MKSLIKKGKEKVNNIKQATDEFSKVPMSIKMELRAIEKKIRGNL